MGAVINKYLLARTIGLIATLGSKEGSYLGKEINIYLLIPICKPHLFSASIFGKKTCPYQSDSGRGNEMEKGILQALTLLRHRVKTAEYNALTAKVHEHIMPTS